MMNATRCGTGVHKWMMLWMKCVKIGISPSFLFWAWENAFRPISSSLRSTQLLFGRENRIETVDRGFTRLYRGLTFTIRHGKESMTT